MLLKCGSIDSVLSPAGSVGSVEGDAVAEVWDCAGDEASACCPKSRGRSVKQNASINQKAQFVLSLAGMLMRCVEVGPAVWNNWTSYVCACLFAATGFLNT